MNAAILKLLADTGLSFVPGGGTIANLLDVAIPLGVKLVANHHGKDPSQLTELEMLEALDALKIKSPEELIREGEES